MPNEWYCTDLQEASNIHGGQVDMDDAGTKNALERLMIEEAGVVVLKTYSHTRGYLRMEIALRIGEIARESNTPLVVMEDETAWRTGQAGRWGADCMCGSVSLRENVHACLSAFRVRRTVGIQRTHVHFSPDHLASLPTPVRRLPVLHPSRLHESC